MLIYEVGTPSSAWARAAIRAWAWDHDFQTEAHQARIAASRAGPGSAARTSEMVRSPRCSGSGRVSQGLR